MVRNVAARCVLGYLVFGGAFQAQATEFGPQAVIRRFCHADGAGQRVRVDGWLEVAPLVTWTLEPAWDHVVLIGSYEVGSPARFEDGAVSIEVRYAVIGQVSAMGLDTAVHVETTDFQVQASPQGWRIAGPPPPPHIFATRVDIDGMRQSLQAGGLNFVPNSIFVWQMFQSAGWDVPFVSTFDLLNGEEYRSVEKPRPGDLAIYLREGVPYHVGVLEAEDQVLSSTLNGGIVRTTTEAFAGELKYGRLVQPAASVESAALPTPDARVDTAAPSADAGTAVVPPPRSSPPVNRTRRQRAKAHRSHAQHSPRKRVRQTKGTKKRAPTAAVKKAASRH